MRTAIKPRWLALLAAVMAIIFGFTILGLWQLDVARSSADREAAQIAQARGVVALPEVARPHTQLGPDAVGRFVVARGRYDETKQILVLPRRLGDDVGMWVLTPLVVQDNGALLPVVRGFVTDPDRVPAPPEGPVTVTGMLAPGEGPPDRPVTLPAGQLPKVDLSLLVNRWPQDLYSGFVFATKEESASASSAAGSVEAIRRVPPPQAGSTGVVWRNLAYALQWWLFAGFAIYMWWRMVGEDHRRTSGEGASSDPGARHDADVGLGQSAHLDASGESPATADRHAAKGR